LEVLHVSNIKSEREKASTAKKREHVVASRRGELEGFSRAHHQ
jgi:hypothetical protein